MSRSTKYILSFKKGLKLPIGLHKATEEKTGLTLGKDGRKVRTVRVISRDDATPTDISEIERVVPWTETENYFPVRTEEGDIRLIEVDKKMISSLFDKSDVMSVNGVIGLEKLSPRMYDGYHYHISCQFEKKSKAVPGNDEKLYTVIHAWLQEYNKALLVKFLTSGREKFAVIYPDAEGLMMSILIHSNYQRERLSSNLIPIEDPVQYGDRLLGPIGLEDIDPDSIIDEYEETLKRYIEEEASKPEEVTPKETVKSITKKFGLKKPKPKGDDFLATLLEL
jgi:non-homologous end joining protein Ku